MLPIILAGLLVIFDAWLYFIAYKQKHPGVLLLFIGSICLFIWVCVKG